MKKETENISDKNKTAPCNIDGVVVSSCSECGEISSDGYTICDECVERINEEEEDDWDEEDYIEQMELQSDIDFYGD